MELTKDEKSAGWTQTPTGSKVYDPLSMVQADWNRKNAAQKVESHILTNANVKKLEARVEFLEEHQKALEGHMTGLRAEFDRAKALKAAKVEAK